MKKPYKESLAVALFGIFIIVATMSWTGCGGKYQIDVPPIQIQVDVVHHISTSELIEVFQAQCRRTLGSDATPEQINNCAQDQVAQFLNDLGSALKGAM